MVMVAASLTNHGGAPTCRLRSHHKHQDAAWAILARVLEFGASRLGVLDALTAAARRRRGGPAPPAGAPGGPERPSPATSCHPPRARGGGAAGARGRGSVMAAGMGDDRSAGTGVRQVMRR
jgi:hypothetical protein